MSKITFFFYEKSKFRLVDDGHRTRRTYINDTTGSSMRSMAIRTTNRYWQEWDYAIGMDSFHRRIYIKLLQSYVELFPDFWQVDFKEYQDSPLENILSMVQVPDKSAFLTLKLSLSNEAEFRMM